METAQLYTIIIRQDGKELKRFESQENDFPALRWIQANQGQSLDWALRYGGWSVEQVDENGNSEYWGLSTGHLMPQRSR